MKNSSKKDPLPTRSIKPIGRYVLVRMAPIVNQTSSGLLLTRETRESAGTVMRLGTKVSEVEVGDYVSIQLGDFRTVKHSNLTGPDDYAMVHVDHIIGIF